MRKAIMVFGPPGAGKGTQANLLAAKLGLIHFDTGKYIESIVQDPSKRNDAEIDKYRLMFDRGELLPPMWVYGIVKEGTAKILDSGFGVVFSGSPRTFHEAFEAEGHDKGFIYFLEQQLGRENVHAIFLKVSPETSIKRNSNRLICSICGTAVMYHEHSRPEFCPICGGLFRRRTLDVPETIKIRLDEYEKKTAPIFTGLKERGFEMLEIDGEPLPYEVFGEIIKNINLK